jgi:hypothetical protein
MFLSVPKAIWNLVLRICRAVVVCVGYPFGYIPGAKLKRGEIPHVPLNPHEQVVRQYYVAVLKAFKADVFLTVTNQRLIISGYRLNILSSVRSRINQQVSIASVSGVFTGYTRITDWSRFVFCFILSLIGRYLYIVWFAARDALGTFPESALENSNLDQASVFKLVATSPEMLRYYFSGSGWWWVAFFALVSYILAQRWIFALQLHSAAASTPIALGEGYGRKSALQGLRGQPTAQTEEMVCELGQLVEDIRLNGDNAIARWTSKSKPEGNFKRAKNLIFSN